MRTFLHKTFGLFQCRGNPVYKNKENGEVYTEFHCDDCGKNSGGFVMTNTMIDDWLENDSDLKC